MDQGAFQSGQGGVGWDGLISLKSVMIELCCVLGNTSYSVKMYSRFTSMCTDI